MIGDPILVNQEDFEKARKILKENGKYNTILIGGGSGTEKSEISYALQKLLYDKSKSSLVLSLDDYYIVHPVFRAENRKKQGIDSVGISEIDWQSLDRIYEDFEEKRPITFRRTHRFLNEIEINTIQNTDGIDYLIIEGLYANYLKKKYKNNLSVFLEGNPSQTLEFRKLRGKENENNKFRQQVVQKEYNVVCQLKRYSDIIVPFKGDDK